MTNLLSMSGLEIAASIPMLWLSHYIYLTGKGSL